MQLIAVILTLLMVCVPLRAAETATGQAAGPTMSRDMMVALARLQMTPEQARQFGAVLQSITAGQLSMARKELRRDKPGVDRIIRKKTQRIINKHDKQVKAFLTADQLALYQSEVKDTLHTELTRPPSRGEGETTTYESREGGGAGGGGCTWC